MKSKSIEATTPHTDMQHTSNCMRLIYVAADIILNEDDDTEDEEDSKFNTESIGLSMCRLLVSDNFREIFKHCYCIPYLPKCDAIKLFW